MGLRTALLYPSWKLTQTFLSPGAATTTISSPSSPSTGRPKKSRFAPLFFSFFSGASSCASPSSSSPPRRFFRAASSRSFLD